MKENNSTSEYSEKEIPGILILGIGNFLLGDEGIGVHMIHFLEKMNLPSNVSLLDGGTGGFHLLSHLENFSHIILIDATMDEKPEGSIEVLNPSFASDFPPSLSSHEIGLRDLIETLYLLNKNPNIILIAVSIKNFQPMSVELSEPIHKIQKKVASQIVTIVQDINRNYS
jgi:hydrogenase maturation protease